MSTNPRGRPTAPLTIALLQAIASAVNPPTRQQLAAMLMDHGAVGAILSTLTRECNRGSIQANTTGAKPAPTGGRPSPLYSLTASGYRRLREAQGLPDAPAATQPSADPALPQALATPRNDAPSGRYTGAELRPYAGRPGAMDAFRLPSLQGGQRVPRRAPIVLGAGPQIHLGRSL